MALLTSVLPRLRTSSSGRLLFSLETLQKAPRTLLPVISLSRHYAFKTDLKIKWVRPVKTPIYEPKGSGDLTPLPHIDKTTLHDDYASSRVLDELTDEQKKLYTLGFLPQQKTFEIQKRKMLELVKRHELDEDSPEAKIAAMTARIRTYQANMPVVLKNKILKTRLKELVERRKKHLKFLRAADYKRFEWILEKLNIEYHPPPEIFETVTRKRSMVKLTQEHCDNIRETRIAEYHKQLEAEKIKFAEEKARLLAWIAEEERACGVTPSSLEVTSSSERSVTAPTGSTDSPSGVAR